MGFLSMIGAVSAEEHNRIVAKVSKQIDDAAQQMKGEDFDLGAGHVEKVGMVMARLRAARSRVTNLSSENAIKAAEIVRLNAEIASLKPDAEAMRAKRQRDRDQKADKKKATSLAAKTAPATGKPRTAVPAKVGKAVSAKISGDRPAKKAVRK